MSSQFLPIDPLEKIALSCSGGGYRAAAFHLGTIAYLHHLQYKDKPLLERVKMISTVSGGTITGVVYALMKANKASFPEIYNFMIGTLGRIDLVKEGLELLHPDKTWDNTAKRKNLINAFAILYDQYFTKGATFSDLDRMRSHLEAVVFNTTEFNNGINFRFRNRGTGFFGNYRIRVSDEAAREVKLADAIAASACFPGGFEPMCWPGDFLHQDAAALKAYARDTEPVGIMDGGIYDNQGIDSILRYKYKSTRNQPYFDLVIVSDVASPYMDPFRFDEEGVKKGWLQSNWRKMSAKIRRRLFWLRIAIALLILIPLALPFLWQYTASIWTGLCIGLSGSGFLFLIAYVYARRKLGGLITAAANRVNDFKEVKFYLEKLSHLRIEEISFRRVQTLLLDRLNSLLTLLSNVFLKVIRRHHYQILYTDEKYEFRRITSLIKELTEADYKAKNKGEALEGDAAEKQPTRSILLGSYEEVVGPHIAKLVEETSTFGTILWFTEDEKLKDLLQKLVATGEVTMCYNMVDYLERLQFTRGNGFAKLPAQTRREVAALYDQCVADWNYLKSDPLALAQSSLTA